MLGTAYRSGARYSVSASLYILNSFNISGTDEASNYDLQIWQMRRVWQRLPRGEKFPLKGAWSGSRDL